MKKLSLVNKLLFFINSIIAATLLFSYLLPFVSPKTIPAFAVFSLLVPVLIIMNLIFCIYWLLKFKKQFILSGLILAIGWSFCPPFYKFSNKEILLNDDVKVMSYNVRMFNHYKWSEDPTIAQKTFDFITEKEPDILTIQEFYLSRKISFKYPYKYIKTKSKTNKFGLAIYSKYKIINSGSLNFKKSANNAIFVDLLKGKDTIRVYNLHLESLKINPNKQHFGEKNSEKLFKRLEAGFLKQADQTAQLLSHQKQFKGKKIICGDFNNTAYSWVYKQIAANKKDAFTEAGNGLGKSFNYPFPMRIDFILTDTSITVNHFKIYPVKYSDHFPILARLNWK
ncbi:endonuclease/exonuclease/phosphatase family protein [Tenacibaculum maritimum]|uniref:endonuclease/exonuclease/phosphatase family protein n=1 Tax=Tenacibaculum maritimum TaxID=107401 RepID=UPI001E5E8725|nr:endonuclease/exonuclease/phosphatase family protein [Tenacibaculum maritimum]MCD9562779.1 endonuclease/exonuclease/phosphatase family protein [Tenacibaculum maritimum]MCD9565883.1 endonuclease/exonuclease/phosphatase family protein [Tenacibaculum maritimum]MCD9579431.1 endonuclease/exonuclease/phosphatase family protein [Tenacibaculum maritimum]MCD9596190.1 endonuclease/exonuclease/phosphatase family protein [Tenacibaculum maritimum]MCD9613439.1 endonuclease/exonuclease/phosphatase family p